MLILNTFLLLLLLLGIQVVTKYYDQSMTNHGSHPYYFHGKYGGLDFLLCCNYDKYFIDKICLPYLYKFVLLHFVELKRSYNTQFCWFVLFSNKDILIGGRPIF